MHCVTIPVQGKSARQYDQEAQMAKEQQIVVRLDEELLSRLEAVVTASRLGTRSDHIRKAIEEYVEHHEPAPVPA